VKAHLRAGRFPGARIEHGAWAIPLDELAAFYRSVDARYKLRRFPESGSDNAQEDSAGAAREETISA